MWKRIGLSAVIALSIAACRAPMTQPKPSSMLALSGFGITLHYPRGLVMHHGFKQSYMANDNWKTYAGAHPPPGHAWAALALPASNQVTSAELRIGISRNKKALQTCFRIPSAAQTGSVGQVQIDGVRFVRYRAADAAMSHYLKVKSFRAIHHNTCYALDILVYGSNPAVYDPPRTPPFSAQHAFNTLVPVVKSLTFTSSPQQ